jgi:hypothetical protein
MRYTKPQLNIIGRAADKIENTNDGKGDTYQQDGMFTWTSQAAYQADE